MPLAGGMQMGLLCKRETRNVVICAKLKGVCYVYLRIYVSARRVFLCVEMHLVMRGAARMFLWGNS